MQTLYLGTVQVKAHCGFRFRQSASCEYYLRAELSAETLGACLSGTRESFRDANKQLRIRRSGVEVQMHPQISISPKRSPPSHPELHPLQYVTYAENIHFFIPEKGQMFLPILREC